MQLDELFHLENQDLRSYSPLTLAYIRDGIYELIIRTVLVRKGNCPVNQLHKKASSLVKAASQSCSSARVIILQFSTETRFDINTAVHISARILLCISFSSLDFFLCMNHHNIFGYRKIYFFA